MLLYQPHTDKSINTKRLHVHAMTHTQMRSQLLCTYIGINQLF